MTIVFDDDELVTTLGAGDAPLPPEAARRWLDERYVEYGCELMRATGKVLNADKLLAVAHAIGPSGFRKDEGLRMAFARAALGAMARNTVHIDLKERGVMAA